MASGPLQSTADLRSRQLCVFGSQTCSRIITAPSPTPEVLASNMFVEVSQTRPL